MSSLNKAKAKEPHGSLLFTYIKSQLCRIPTFGTRIPQIAAKSQPVPLKSPSPIPEIGEEHIGRSVRVGDKEGVLKYVGSVHFAKGTWCGIELTTASGKNNGTVNDVPYFSCEDLRGLMAPASKVSLTEGSSETGEGDNVSGPYSILCLAPKLPQNNFTPPTPNLNCTDNKVSNCQGNCTYEIAKENQNCTYDAKSKADQNNTYGIVNHTCTSDSVSYKDHGQTFNWRRTFDAESADDLRRQVLTERSLRQISENQLENPSEDEKQRTPDSYDLKSNRACSIDNLDESPNSTYNLKNSKDITLSAENLNRPQSNTTQTINTRQVSTGPSTPEERLASSFRNKTFELALNSEALGCLANSKKRTNETFSENDHQKQNNFNNTFNASKLNSPTEGPLPYLPITNSCEDLLKESTVEVKRRRTSISKADVTLERVRSVNTNNTPIKLNQPNHSTPLRGGFTDDLRNIRLSNILAPQDNDLNAQNTKGSLDQDSTIGILGDSKVVDFDQSNVDIERLLSKFDVKRRKTKTDSSLIRPVTLEKPSSLPQLRIAHQLHSNGSSFLNLKQLDYSNPIRSDFLDDLRKLQGVNVTLDNESENSKRDSLDCEESLGILTPDQMVDFTHCFEYDKLLGTPDQTHHYSQNQSPIIEHNPIIVNKIHSEPDLKKLIPSQELNQTSQTFIADTTKTKDVYEEAQSPNLNSVTDYSFGIIDPDQMLSAFTILKTDTTMNLDLPLDPVADSKNFTLTRCDETPSPEELPLDTTPIVESEPSKTDTTKSKTNSSFITSITSITSLDTGYQGDGEMSRPASRGADNSPLTRRPFPRPLPRRPDPMTDSDFYTESDADNHEDIQVKGDRRAQVIDGTLYGVDPQAAADIYVNNRENMDSSGVFTDIESGLRNDDDVDNGNESGLEHNNNKTIDVSPSDSTKTISDNSQSNIQEVLQKSTKSNDLNDSSLDKTVKENPKKRNAPSPGISSPSSLSSPRHLKEENAAKKYKMPKRDVASKVKAMLVEPSSIPSTEKKLVKKPVNRWDAVMNKISKNEQNKTNLKEIKSKVFDNVNLTGSTNSTRTSESRTIPVHTVAQQNKSRRIRTRTPHNSSSLKKTIGNNIQSSIHSSLSDLSASTAPPKKAPGSTKKRDTIQVTQVLTPNKLSSKNQQNLAENKKNVININSMSPSSQNEIKPKRTTIFPTKEKKLQIISKESSKPTVKGGRTSPSVRSPAQQTTRAPVKKLIPAPRAAEALAVLVQHLVFNVEAYQVPHLRRQVEKLRLEAEEIRLAYRHLEDALGDEKLKNVAVIEEERVRCRNDITELIERHRNQITQISSHHAEADKQLRLERESSEQHLSQRHDEQLTKLRKELEKLQKSHEEALDILREENDCIREQIDEKGLELEKANHESTKLKDDYETKEIKLKEEVETVKSQRDKLKHQIGKLENDFQDKIKSFVEENKRLREQNDRLLSYGDDKDIAKQEVQSLRVVLELKQDEIAELRKSLEEAKQKQQILDGAEEKAASLKARCEDLQHQLQRKSEYEQTLIQENQKLQDSFKEKSNHTRRLSQHNEELQWKLRQNKEVFTKVIEQASEDSVFNRSGIYSSSFNEKHLSSKSLERTQSFREYTHKSGINFDCSSRSRKSNSSIFDEEFSPPSSPKVKGVVEKSDSVSYVLDLDENPDLVASRILRRSFRNTTPPKNTLNKSSPSSKRPRNSHPLSISMSSSALLHTDKEEVDRPRSASGRNGNEDVDDVFLWANGGHRSTPNSSHSSMKLDDNLDLDEYNEVDLRLPALPSEMDKRNGILALPSPKRLAADAAGSDTNSEDESTSSSQL